MMHKHVTQAARTIRIFKLQYELTDVLYNQYPYGLTCLEVLEERDKRIMEIQDEINRLKKEEQNEQQ